MKKQKKLRVLVLGTGVLLVGFTAYAENIQIATFYPSPYGSYQNLDTTADTHLATNGGGVTIGLVGNTLNSLQVHNPAANDTRMNLTHGLSGSARTDGLILGLDAANQGLVWNNENGALNLGTNNISRVFIGANGNVGVGNTNPNFNLHVNGTIGITQAGNTGPLAVAYNAGDQRWYAVYA